VASRQRSTKSGFWNGHASVSQRGFRSCRAWLAGRDRVGPENPGVVVMWSMPEVLQIYASPMADEIHGAPGLSLRRCRRDSAGFP
jgi:hypothetical protein